MSNVYQPIGNLFNIEKGSLQSTKCTAGEYDFITAASDWKNHEDYTHECEALVFAAAASGSLGRTHYVDGQFVASDLCFILTPKNEAKFPINMQFYHFVFNSLRSVLVAATKSGTSKESINQKNFKKYEIPYFEIEQQDLWIEKLKNTLVRKELIESEVISQTRLTNNLRKRSLQDAIEGKITAQWRTDNSDVESSETLLSKLQKHKEKLIAQKEIKKQKALKDTESIIKPFALPDKWQWCRLGDLVHTLQYGTSKKCNYEFIEGTPILRIPNVSSGVIDVQDLKFTDLTDLEKQKYSLQKNDLLIIRSNGSRELVGKSVLVSDECEGYGYAGYLIKIKLLEKYVNPEYINLCLGSSLLREQIETPLRTTVGINNINSTELCNLFVPLPPMSEQSHIVQHIKKIKETCSLLEANINSSKSYITNLLPAVLEQAFERSEPLELKECA